MFMDPVQPVPPSSIKTTVKKDISFAAVSIVIGMTCTYSVLSVVSPASTSATVASAQEFNSQNIAYASTTQEQTPVIDEITARNNALRESALQVQINAPQGNASLTAPIQITFDRTVDSTSAEKAFKISPSVKGTFEWKDAQTLVFTPTKLAYQTDYTVSMATSVTPVAGLAPQSSIKATFTTIAEEFMLDVPSYQQPYTNSCETTALRMALEHYGIVKNEMELLQKIGYNPRDKNIEKNEWDDPQEMFVGFIDGMERNHGYGVYGKPILKAVESFGRTGVYKTDIDPTYLAREIKAGHPIIIWGNTSLTEAPYTWTTPAGNTVTAFRGEHARVLIGVRGSVAHPLGFYLNDPINGNSNEYWDVDRLLTNANSVPGVTNQIVVVK